MGFVTAEKLCQRGECHSVWRCFGVASAQERMHAVLCTSNSCEPNGQSTFNDARVRAEHCSAGWREPGSVHSGRARVRTHAG